MVYYIFYLNAVIYIYFDSGFLPITEIKSNIQKKIPVLKPKISVDNFGQSGLAAMEFVQPLKTDVKTHIISIMIIQQLGATKMDLKTNNLWVEASLQDPYWVKDFLQLLKIIPFDKVLKVLKNLFCIFS